MEIKEVNISKFRSIESGSFEFNKIVAIVGQNNAGKSAVMRALNSFFNPSEELPHFLNGSHLYTQARTIPRITIVFDNVPNNETYIPYLLGNMIKIRQEFNKKRKRLEYSVFHNGSFENTPSGLIEKLFTDMQFVLIPSERGIELRGQDDLTILRKLFDAFFAIHTAKRDTLSPKVNKAFQYLRRNALVKVASGINEKYLVSKNFKIEIDTKYPLTYELFVNDLALKVVESGKEFRLDECGSGVQSLIAIAIYRYLADINNTNYIIGIEEPEINLHPQAQKELIFSLLDEVNSEGIQVIFTTHSTVLIDELDHTKIVIARKEDDSRRKFKTSLHQLRSDFWDFYDIEVLQYDKFHKFRNSDFFFANHVIVTESQTDSEVFRNLLKWKGIVIERCGISILELGGIKSLKYAFYLLRDLNIPKTIILDKDFFFLYQNGSKDNSRYGNGFFNYKTTFKNEQIIKDIFYNTAQRQRIETLLSTNHSKALDLTLKYDVICMKYNMEMDLVASTIAQQLIYDKLNIPAEGRNTQNLLINYEKSVKKLGLLLYVIENMPHRNLPNSYKRLIRRFKEIKKHIIRRFT